MMKKLIFSLLLAFFLLAANSVSFAEPRTPLLLPPSSAPTNVDTNSIPAILPRSEVLLDEHLLSAFFDTSSSMSIDEVADKTKEELFTPFSLQPFEKVSGAMWLRFVLAPAEESSLPPNQLFLDLGSSVPEKAALYVRSQTLKEPTPTPKEETANKAKGSLDIVQSSDLGSPNLPLEWREILPAKRGLFALPKAGKTALTCYLRLDGVPGVWFTPVLRTVDNTLKDWGSCYRLGAVIVMSVLFVLCLFRCLVEQGTWRLWGLLYIVCAGAQMWIGIPSVQETLGWQTLLALALPVLALTLYPHLGRKLLCCPKEAPLLNAQFILLSLVALVAIALPFIPSMKWIYRFIDLWPLGLILFVPTALFACFRRRPGAFRFFIGSLIPPAAILAIGYAGPQTPFSANFISAIPAWATAFSAIFIIGLPLGTTPQKTLSLNLESPQGEESGELSLGGEKKKQGTALTLLDEGKKKTPLSENLENLALQAALTNSVAKLYEQSKILCSTELPEPAKTASLQIASTAEEISLALGWKGESNSHAPLAVSIFNIRNLLSSTRETIQQKLAQKKAFVSWTPQSNLGEYYEGPAMEFAHVVTMLCESMTAPESKILFTFKPEASKGTAVRFLACIAGGSTLPSPLAITAAKRLAQECRGGFKLESHPTETTVLFNVGFIQQIDAKAASQLENIQQSNKKLNILFLIEDPRISVRILALSKELPCTIRLAATPDELVSLHKKFSAHMFIFQGASTASSSERLIATLKQISTGQGLPAPIVLAYTADKSTWNSLAKIGFTHALTLPVEKGSFIETFSEAFHEAFSARQEVRNPEPPLQMARAPETQLHMNGMPEPALQATRPSEPPLQMARAPETQLHMTGMPEPTLQATRASEPPLQMARAPETQLRMTGMPEPALQATRASEPPLQMTDDSKA